MAMPILFLQATDTLAPKSLEIIDVLLARQYILLKMVASMCIEYTRASSFGKRQDAFARRLEVISPQFPMLKKMPSFMIL